MSETKIEWTDRTWNPVTGCTKVSPGCDHCYAEGIARRFAGTKAFPQGFDVTLRPERLDAPLRWRKPARVFVNSMSDLFHKDVPDEFIGSVWNTMALTPQHTYQILTKRPARARALLTRWAEAGWMWRRDDLMWCGPLTGPLPNVWIGTSVEDQKRADLRIPALLQTPAAVRFLSCEPLLGPVDLQQAVNKLDWLDAANWKPGGIDWVIVGGESGPGARPMHPQWARDLRDQCVASEVPFFFKQHGEWLGTDKRDPRYTGPVKGGWVKYDGTGWAAFTLPVPEAPAWVLRLGKNAAGRELDGRIWDEFPGRVA